MQTASRPPSFLPYVIGNASALLIGLIVAYFALTISGTADASVLNIRTVDLMEYYSASHLIGLGHAGAMYDLGALGRLQLQLVGHTRETFGTLAYLYPPYFVAALLPLTFLPYGVAYVVWLAFNCVLLAAALYFLERYAGLRGRKALAFRGVAISFLPVFMVLGFGQASVFLLALFTLCFLAARGNHPVLAGVALALATLKPFYVAPLLLVFLLQRQWRTLAAYAVTLTGLLVAVVPVLGPGIYVSYVRLLLQVGHWQGRSIHAPLWYHHLAMAPGMYTAQWNHSLAGFIELLFPAPTATLLTLWLDVAMLGLVVVIAWKAQSLELPLVMAIPVGLLVSPHTLAYDLTLLLIPVAVAIRYRRLGPRYLPAFLTVGYLAVAAGYKLAFFVPVQITVLATGALALWLIPLALRVGREDGMVKTAWPGRPASTGQYMDSPQVISGEIATS